MHAMKESGLKIILLKELGNQSAADNSTKENSLNISFMGKAS